MIPTSTVNEPADYAPGWLGRYVETMGRNFVPWSFHILAGIFVLGSVVGRKAALVRPAGTLYPPQSIILLGESGVGKGQALEAALGIVRAATEERAGFYVGEGGFTLRGIVEHWQRLQRREKTQVLEGVHVEDEIMTVLRERAGNEGIVGWLIRALAHRDLVDYTALYGKSLVTGVTVSFGFGSTLSYLRRAVSIDDFTGGLMHRFLIAYEWDPRDGDEERPTPAQVEVLVEELREIAHAAPDEMTVAPDAEAKLQLLRGQARRRHFDNHHLAGFWNRVTMLTLRLAMNYALAEHRWEVGEGDVLRAHALLTTKCYPPLDGVVAQLALSARQRELLDVAESLLRAGPEGWTRATLTRKIARPPRQLAEAIFMLEQMSLLFWAEDRCYATRAWAEAAA